MFLRVLLFLLCLITSAWAHEPFLAEIKGVADDSTLTLEVVFARSVAAYVAGKNAAPRDYYAPERFEQERSAFEKMAGGICELKAGGELVQPVKTSVETREDEEIDVVYTLIYPRPVIGPLRLTCPWLPRMPEEENYKASLVIHESGKLVVGPLLMNYEETGVDFSLPPGPSRVAAVRGSPPPVEKPKVDALGFFKLGVEHILGGYDHLLFLAALMLGCGANWRVYAGIITAFTVSHSITLAVATLGWVHPPSALVEQFIAASIVYVAVENLWLRGKLPRFRQALSFFFGLIHGFGFASVLSKMGIGRGDSAVVVPLLTFNLGVEAGQILVVVFVMPLLVTARRSPGFLRYGQPAASLVVALMGAWWLIERF